MIAAIGMNMKIAIDARFLGPEGTGIGKYIEKLLENLQNLDSENEYVVILRRTNFNLFNQKAKNFKKIMADSSWYTLKEQVLLPAVLSKIRPDLVHFPHFNVPLLYPGKFVLTVHDITKSEFKNIASTTHSKPIFLLKHTGYEFVLNQAVHRAKKILVPSNHVKNKLLESFDLENDKLVVTYEAADDIYSKSGSKKISKARKRELLQKYKIKEPFIIYVGNAYAYKNLSLVLEALKFLDEKVYFVHAAVRNQFVDRLIDKAKEIGVVDSYINTGFIPNDDLAEILPLSQAFVFPSLSEGFGLPGIEAMAAGCPVIASNIPVFKEVYGSAALFFDPRDPKELAKKIQSITNDENLTGWQSGLKMELRKKGLKQVKKYSWKKMAQQTFRVYEAV